MTEAARCILPADEFLGFEGDDDTRYELHGGVVVAMAPVTDVHATIAANASFEATLRLDGKPPGRSGVEAGIRISEHDHDKADVAATCAEPDGSRFFRDPFLLVEVLSASSATDDLGIKLPRSVALPSVREVWLADPRERWVQVWRRSGDAWIVTLPLRGSATFRSDALDDEITLDGLYGNTGL